MTSVQPVAWLFAVGWALFWAYWLIAAFSRKRGRVPWARELPIRGVLLVVVVALVHLGAFRHSGNTRDAWRSVAGLLVFVAGLGFAVWARVHIGRNWGGPVTEKDEPELVTSGPYRLVRHPIYSGILLAGIGCAVGLYLQLLLAVAVAAIYFGYSAAVEERYLTHALPDSYPAYKRSTRMLVPFLV